MSVFITPTVEDRIVSSGLRVWETYSAVPDGVPYTHLADAIIRLNNATPMSTSYWVNHEGTRFTKVEGQPMFTSIFSADHMNRIAPFVEVERAK